MRFREKDNSESPTGADRRPDLFAHFEDQISEIPFSLDVVVSVAVFVA